jgi:hypothetical protein
MGSRLRGNDGWAPADYLLRRIARAYSRSTNNSTEDGRFLADSDRKPVEKIFSSSGTSASAQASFYRKQQSYQLAELRNPVQD